MAGREKLLRLKTNSKLIELQQETNGVIEELLEEDEMDITDINNLTYRLQPKPQPQPQLQPQPQPQPQPQLRHKH